MTEQRFAHEKRLHVLARHGQSVRRRWAFAALGLAIGLADAPLDFFPAPWYLAVVAPLALIAANAWCALRVRAGRARPAHFWAMLGADAFVLAAMCALGGRHGPLVIGFYVAIAAAYGLGLPPAARAHIALTTVLYPAARAIGGARSVSGILLETFCLCGVSWLAIESPMRFTYRLRRARRALGALEQGDFTQRLPTRALDDLGFLAASYNSTAEALGAAVEELRRSREALAHQAYHDPLTGLANRARFQERLRRALGGDRATRAAVLMVDLDGFKDVNDRLGHAAGDRLLTAVAERLLDATRGRDTVARLGGDEFAILLENVDRVRDAEIVAERVVRALGASFDMESTRAHVGASVGVARNLVGVVAEDDAGDVGDALRAARRRGDVRGEVRGQGVLRRRPGVDRARDRAATPRAPVGRRRVESGAHRADTLRRKRHTASSPRSCRPTSPRRSSSSAGRKSSAAATTADRGRSPTPTSSRR